MPKVTKHPLVTIFIPTGSRAKDLETVLHSLTKQSFKDFEILIVDYHSPASVTEVIYSYSKRMKIRLIHQQTKGLVKAANLALQASSSTYFIRTDDDVQMTPHWLESIISTFQSDSRIGGVTGPTLISKEYMSNRDIFLPTTKSGDKGLFWSAIRWLYQDFFLEHQATRVSHWFDSGAFSVGSNFQTALTQPLQQVINLEACNFAVIRQILVDQGGFDEIYAGVGDYHEADAAFKVQQAGFKLVFNPQAALHHFPSQSGFFQDRPSSYQRMVNFIVFYMRHIKLNTIRKCVRFSLYILFQNCYYVYQAIQTKQLNQLGALIGTFSGFYNYFLHPKQYESSTN